MGANYNEKFKETFSDFNDYYVIIGGTATSFILDDRGFNARTTKDYDMVVIKPEEDFYHTIIKFLEEGSYLPEVMEGNKLYRFTTKDKDYPKMIELFSQKPFELNYKSRVTPLPFSENLSLSALLLDEAYYELLVEGKFLLNGYSVLEDKCLIVFKSKAWLDLKSRKAQGDESSNSSDIKKHLNDIARLTGSLMNTAKIDLPPTIKEDMNQFLILLKENIELIPQNKEIILTKSEIFEILNELLG